MIAARPLTKHPVNTIGVLTALRDGQELTRSHVDFFANNVSGQNGQEPLFTRPQAAAALMAIQCKGMSPQNTMWLTNAMAKSGRTLDLSRVNGTKVDKHSCGGVSDGTSFIIAPLLALYGLIVPMMSGRGLQHTGGTLDKLEAIPGFNVDLSEEEIVRVLNRIGLAIFSTTPDIAPADGVLYGLRNETQTVPSIPLITASILSKKLAEGAEILSLNVTTGSGSFMKEKADAIELARMMVETATLDGRKTTAVVSDMNQPLAPFVGNAIEIVQALRILRGETEGFERFITVCIELAAPILVDAGIFTTLRKAKSDLRQKLASGAALAKFREMVQAQGGDLKSIDSPSNLPRARTYKDVLSPKSGWVTAIDATAIGMSAFYLGGGRAKAGDPIDHAVGLMHQAFLGDRVEEGKPLATLYVNDEAGLEQARETLLNAFGISSEEPAKGTLPKQIIKVIR